ncbi:hypothetical protein B0H14DRAFT_3458244 [Mycena olivaceomarginata]|nr:hypothetical protein B0H14DRAFT_3458244 [Mycena olivaceomarginata]
MPATVPAPPDLTTLRPGSLISDKGDVYLPPPRPEIVKRGKEKKARRKKVAGAFYTKMAKLYIIKYGCHLAADDDFAYDVADPPNWVANKVVNERLSPEETTFRQEYHTILRDRLGKWYRRQGGRKPPRCPQLLHFHSEKRYDEHIKPRVEARKKSLAVRAEMTGVKAPAAITIQNEVTKECWDEESDLTPEEFSASLKSAAHYLQPFVDIISERFGMCVSILMAGPIGEHGGRIEMRSVHVGKTRGLVEKDWPLQDPEGFTRVQSSMVDFAHHVFSRAECESRVTEVQELIPDVGSESGAELAAAPAARVRQSPSGGGGGGVSAAGQGGINSTGEGDAPTTASQPAPISEGRARGASNVGRDEGGGDGMDQGEENEDPTVEGQVEKLWQRRDAGRWTEELKRAHTAFSRGKAWGIEWASLVDKYYDFEAAWGHRDEMGENGGYRRGGQREGARNVRVGVVDWWVNVQLAERGDWPVMLKLHGKNGLLQLMVSLLWWGERVADGNPGDVREWSTAVEDVGDVFTELLRPGLIAKLKTTETRGKEAAEREEKKGC